MDLEDDKPRVSPLDDWSDKQKRETAEEKKQTELSHLKKLKTSTPHVSFRDQPQSRPTSKKTSKNNMEAEDTPLPEPIMEDQENSKSKGSN